MPYKDKQKQLEYQRSWNKSFYQENKASERQRIIRRKQEIAEWFTAYKSKLSCEACGETATVCLDFHHKQPNEKDFNLAFAKNWGWSKARIEQEVEKCIVLCANCHRKVHANLIKVN